MMFCSTCIVSEASSSVVDDVSGSSSQDLLLAEYPRGAVNTSSESFGLIAPDNDSVYKMTYDFTVVISITTDTDYSFLQFYQTNFLFGDLCLYSRPGRIEIDKATGKATVSKSGDIYASGQQLNNQKFKMYSSLLSDVYGLFSMSVDYDLNIVNLEKVESEVSVPIDPDEPVEDYSVNVKIYDSKNPDNVFPKESSRIDWIVPTVKYHMAVLVDPDKTFPAGKRVSGYIAFNYACDLKTLTLDNLYFYNPYESIGYVQFSHKNVKNSDNNYTLYIYYSIDLTVPVDYLRFYFDFQLGLGDGVLWGLDRSPTTVSVTNISESYGDVLDRIESNTKEQSETQKGIFASIKEFFGSFFQNLIDSVVHLFVPTTDEMKSLFDELNQFFSDRFGFLYYPFDFLIRAFNALMSPKTSTALTFPGFSIMGQQVWDDITYDIASNQIANTVFTTVRIVTGVTLAVYFINYLRNFFDKRFGGGGR